MANYPTSITADGIWSLSQVAKNILGGTWPTSSFNTFGRQYAEDYISKTDGALIEINPDDDIDSTISSASNGDAILLSPGIYQSIPKEITSKFCDLWREKNLLLCGDTSSASSVIVNLDYQTRDYSIFVGDLDPEPTINRQCAFLTLFREKTDNTSYQNSLVRMNGSRSMGRMVNCIVDNNGGEISWHYDNDSSNGSTVEFINCTFMNYSGWDNSHSGRDDQIKVGNCLFSADTQEDEYIDLGSNETQAYVNSVSRSYNISAHPQSGHLYIPNVSSGAQDVTSSDLSSLFDVAVFLDPQGSDSNDGLSETSPVQTISRAYTVAQNNTSGSEQVLIYFEDGNYTTNENEVGAGNNKNACDLPNFQALGECHFMSRNPGGATITWVKDLDRDSFFQHDHKAQNQLHFIGLEIVGDTNGTDWSGNYQMSLICDGRYGDHSTEDVGNDIITFNNCLITTQDPTQYGYSYGYFNGPTYSFFYGSLRFNHCLFDMPSAEQYTNNTGGWECGHIGSGVTGSNVESWATIPSGYNNMDTMTTGATTAILNNGNFDWSNYPSASTFVFP